MYSGNCKAPASSGPAIAAAFTATLWGVMLANVVWLPMSNKLRRRSEEEVAYREMVTEGLLTMQLNVSSLDLRDRLFSYLPPSERSESPAAPPDALVAVEAA